MLQRRHPAGRISWGEYRLSPSSDSSSAAQYSVALLLTRDPLFLQAVQLSSLRAGLAATLSSASVASTAPPTVKAGITGTPTAAKPAPGGPGTSAAKRKLSSDGGHGSTKAAKATEVRPFVPVWAVLGSRGGSPKNET